MNDVWLWISIWWDHPLTKQGLLLLTGCWFANTVVSGPKKRRRVENVARRAIGTYLVTGRETEALALNPRSVVEAAKRHRTKYLEKKLKERLPFSAWCNCPKCGSYDLHWMWGGKEGIPNNSTNVTRTCRNCGVVWNQLR